MVALRVHALIALVLEALVVYALIAVTYVLVAVEWAILPRDAAAAAAAAGEQQ